MTRTFLALVLLLGAAPAVNRADEAPGPGTATVDSATLDRTRTVQRAFADALVLEQRGDLRTAIGAYRAVLAADSTYPEANFRMGRLYAGYDRLMDAIRAYRTELKFHPGHVAAQRELGLMLVRTGETKRGLPMLVQLTQKQPQDDQAWQALGFAYSIAGRQADAEKALRLAIAYPPERASEHRDLGVVLATLGREGDAREEYRAALALDDTDPATWTNLGNLEARGGRWKEALAAYRTATAHDTTYATAVQGQIQALDALGDKAGAAQMARHWLTTRPDDHRARLEAVSRFHQLGKDDVAMAIAREGVALSPRSGDAHVVLSSMLDLQGKTREALRELRLASRLFPDPLNRGQVISMLQATMAAAPESIRVLARADSTAEEARRAVRRTATRR